MSQSDYEIRSASPTSEEHQHPHCCQQVAPHAPNAVGPEHAGKVPGVIQGKGCNILGSLWARLYLLELISIFAARYRVSHLELFLSSRGAANGAPIRRGKYINLTDPKVTRPWIGLIVSNRRIDGRWTGGRLDFRR